MQKIREKGRKFLSGLLLFALIFGLVGSALPKPVKAAGEDFKVYFESEWSEAVEGQDNQVQISVNIQNPAATRSEIRVDYQITFTSASVDDFEFNGRSDVSGSVIIPAADSFVLVPLHNIDDT